MTALVLQEEMLKKHQEKFSKVFEIAERLLELSPQELALLETQISPSAIPASTPEEVIVPSPATLNGWGGVVGEVLSLGEMASVRESLDALRLRMCALSFLNHAENVSGDKGKSFEQLLHQEKKFGTVIHSLGDVVSSTFEDITMILLPRITGRDHAAHVVSGLVQILDETEKGRSWIVDFSAVKTISAFMFGSILGFDYNLRDRGGSLFATWIPDALFPEKTMVAAAAHYHLRKIGNHWFSEKRKER